MWRDSGVLPDLLIIADTAFNMLAADRDDAQIDLAAAGHSKA